MFLEDLLRIGFKGRSLGRWSHRRISLVQGCSGGEG
jgi:hypothetical protein